MRESIIDAAQMSMKKKILFVITKGNFGGAQKYVYDLATNLPKEKFEVIVACGEGDKLREELQNKNIQVIKILSSQRDINPSKDIVNFFELWRIIKDQKPDILHLNSSKAGGLGTLAGRIIGIKKIIFTSHGWAFNEDRSFVAKTIILFFHWLTVLLSHTTIAVSIKTAKDISWLPFIQGKIKVIHNGIVPFQTLSKDQADMIIPRKDKALVIFTTAELHKNKSLDIAIQGLGRLPVEIRDKMVYYIAGEGEERHALETQIKNLGLEKNVVLLGFVDNAKKLLGNADLFLFPSKNENLPFAILEAGICGVPIVSTSVGGIPEIIYDTVDGILVHKNNPREIAEAITYMFEHPKEAKEFGKKIKEKIENNFSFEEMFGKTITLYSS